MIENFLHPPDEIINIYKPAPGLENDTFTLEGEPDKDGLRAEPKDDWIFRNEVQNETGEFEVSMYRKNADGTIEEHAPVPSGEFLAIQDEQKLLRRDRAVRHSMVEDASQSRQEIVEMMKNTRAYRRNRTLGDIAMMDFQDDKRERHTT